MGFSHLRAVSAALLLMYVAPEALARASSKAGEAVKARRNSSSYKLSVGGAVLEVDFAPGTAFDLPESDIVGRVQTAADAVTLYYGRFPVSPMRVLILPVAGEDGVVQGTTWGDRDGFAAVTRLRIGQHTTHTQLTADWIMTHEMVHTALASLPDAEGWLEEGLATYVEPMARAQNHELAPAQVWGDMVRGMPQGEPGPEDRGLDNTDDWGRTYWGGAMFCLLADIEIRKQTHNRLSLQDALRAIVRSGGTIDSTWPLQRILALGDHATGTHVLEDMYHRWSNAPVPVDLNLVWGQLGVQMEHGHVTFNDHAPLASMRAAFTTAAAAPAPND